MSDAKAEATGGAADERPSPARAIDGRASRVRVRTRATGLFARVAHDLELEASELEGTVEHDGDAWRLELVCTVRGLRVAGVVRQGKLDRGVLSASDVAEIERKLKEEVLLGARIEVRGAGDRRRGELTVTAPRGEQKVAVSPRITIAGAATTAEAEACLSLARLGIAEIKGPLGAFKVHDEVAVRAKVVLAECGSRAEFV